MGSHRDPANVFVIPKIYSNPFIFQCRFSLKMKRCERGRALTQAQLEELAANLNIDSETDYYTDDGSDDEECFIEQNVSETEDNLEIQSEEESDEEPEQPENSDNDNKQCPRYVAKSGLEWNSQPFRKSKKSQKNIVSAHPGITQYSANCNLITEIFNLFLTTEMKDKICLYTNEEAARYYERWNEKHPTLQKQWVLLEREELDSFIGVLIKAGTLRCRKESTREMWTTNSAIRRAFFTAALSRNRFEQIATFLRFDDKRTRAERKEHDKLAAIRELWDAFVNNCNKAFEPYEHITIDEQLVCFRGKCPFRQYIKSKSGRYGIRIWAAADVKTSYLCNLQIYTGKLPGGAAEHNQGFRVVSDLAKPYYGSWRGITTDNFFTSVPLANYLLTKKLTLLGTVRKNKPDTPTQLNITHRPVQSSIFAFTKELTMVSYIPKKKRMVHLLSSQHDDDSISEEKQNKPQMILEYNKTKGGVDNADKLIREYSCTRRTARWPYRIFMNMIDICALNAFVIYTEKNPDWKKQNSDRRRYFLMLLADYLARPNMEKRATYPHHKEHVKSALRNCGINVESSQQKARPDRKRGRCHQCPRVVDKKVNISCAQCHKFACEMHRKKQTVITCSNCLSE